MDLENIKVTWNSYPSIKKRLKDKEITQRDIAKKLYATVKDLPIISPHGHTDPCWFSENKHFKNPADLFIKPDHYVFRMMFSQGISIQSLGIEELNKESYEKNSRKIWKLFAKNYYLFRGTPTRIWLDNVFENLFKIDVPLNADNANFYYEKINSLLNTDDFYQEIFLKN